MRTMNSNTAITHTEHCTPPRTRVILFPTPRFSTGNPLFQHHDKSLKSQNLINIMILTTKYPPLQTPLLRCNCSPALLQRDGGLMPTNADQTVTYKHSQHLAVCVHRNLDNSSSTKRHQTRRHCRQRTPCPQLSLPNCTIPIF